MNIQTYVDGFLENAANSPEKVAVLDLHGADTYGRVNNRSAFLAHELLRFCQEAGTDVRQLRREGKNGARIAVLLPRTREYVTAVTSVVRAGCCLVPLDAEYPEERIRTILEDAGCVLCITVEKLAARVGAQAPVLLLDQLFHSLAERFPGYVAAETEWAGIQEICPGADRSLNLSAARIEGLIIYTSGSTGKPKGVIHCQSQFHSCYATVGRVYEFTAEDRLLCMAGFTFIASVIDLFPALISGGSVYVADEDERKNVDKLFTLIRKRGITGMYLPPRMFDVMREIYGRLPLRYVILSGEKAKTSCSEDGNLLENYGSSEASSTLIHRVGYGDPRSLGKPAWGVEAFLVDENDRLITVPGEAGELCVCSPWLALGYNGLEKETAERFVSCPFRPGQRMYRTGDYMAWDEQGNLIFHGRKDRMVKIRGYRVEMGEIEHTLQAAEGISEAACVAIRVGGADKLCCYYAGKTEASPAQLKAFLSRSLPEYMIPDYLVRLETLPRNERNKMDYLSLKAMDPPVQEGEYLAPETESEERVCRAFAAALGLKQVSVTADFFDLGGTSLSAAVLISHLSDLREGLAFQDVIHHPTARALAAFLTQDKDRNPDKPAMDRDFYPLTKTQLGIYLEANTGGNSGTYSSPYLMTADSSVTAEQLVAAVHTLVSAHPGMKYIIRVGADGMPHMFMAPEEKVEIPVVDGAEEERLDFLRRFMPVVPMTDHLLFYFSVYRTPQRCYLALRSHLIFFDGTSVSLLIAELNRALSGQALRLEEYTIQQVGMAEERQMRDGAHERAEQYFTNLFREMEDLPAIPLSTVPTPGVSENLRFMPGTLRADRIRSFCRKNQITESSFFLGAMALLLGKYLNTRHVSFSTVYNGRAISGTENTLGTLIKRIPVYANLSRNMPVGDFLRGIGRQVFETMSNDIFSFDEVLKTCPVNEDVEFIYQGDLFTDQMGGEGSGPSLLKGDKRFMEQYHTGMVTGCFSIQCFSTGGLYNMTIEYRNECFRPAWVERLAGDLFIVAEELMRRDTFEEITILTDSDRQQLARFNDTKVDVGFIPVQEQIHAWAVKQPEALAVFGAGERLTFARLDSLSDRVASALRSLGVKRETLVAVLLDREVRAYVAEIGILRAGGAFVPFIPEYPDDRIAFCMEDGQIPVLLTSERLREERPGLQNGKWQVVAIEELLAADPGDPVPAETQPQDLAYCIYTSGTTGRPKGVMIEHRNIANYVNRNEKSLEIMYYAAPGRVCLALASFSFDVSVVEAFVPLCNGNPVILATEEEIHTPSLLSGLIREQGVNGITCTPTFLMSLLDIPECLEAIRQLTFFDIGAEAFPPRLYERLRALREDSVILNVYGPTEATMGCAAEEMTSGERITVGRPIANTYFFVADPFGEELPVGIRGELIICGDQVGRGYLNLPEKTAASFFLHNGMRAYRSGDLACWTEEGKMRVFGRVDQQIKLRGFRIELGEIEKVISEYPGVKTAAALIQKTAGMDYLVGYYSAPEPVSQDQLKAYLRSRLPEYMVPSALVFVASMPMTVNGKVDRRKLPAPDFSAFRGEYVAPRTENERKICHGFAAALQVPEDRVGVLDDFFELGGDSLRAMIALSEIGLDALTAADIFRKRTPEAIAQAVADREGLGSLDEREAAARKVPHMLTPVQAQMIDLQLYRPGSTMWSNTHFLVRFDRQEIDADRLCAAVNAALHHHPMLSTAIFFDDNNELVQQYMPGLLPEVKVRDIREETARLLPDVLVLPFDRVMNAALCRVRMFRAPEYVYLFMDIHHLVLDGTSLGVLLRDVVNAYFGRELKPDYYFALLAEEERRIAGGSRTQDKNWFLERFGDEVWCTMPAAGDALGDLRQGTREQRLSFDALQVKKAETFWGVSHSVMAITAALIALSRFTGHHHVMIDWVFNNRLAPESENAVGMLIKSMPAAARMEEYRDTRQLLLAMKEQVAESIAHCTYDFMQEHYQAFRVGSDCLEVNLQLGINGDELALLHPEPVELKDAFTAAAGILSLNLLENEYGDGGFDSEMEYAEERFEKDRIEAFHDLYISILEKLIACEEP